MLSHILHLNTRNDITFFSLTETHTEEQIVYVQDVVPEMLMNHVKQENPKPTNIFNLQVVSFF